MWMGEPTLVGYIIRCIHRYITILQYYYMREEAFQLVHPFIVERVATATFTRRRPTAGTICLRILFAFWRTDFASREHAVSQAQSLSL